MVLVNDCATSTSPKNVITRYTLKYVDDLSVLESINLKFQLSDNHEREQPDNYRSRTGHQLLPRCTMGTGGELKWRMSGIICSFTLPVTLSSQINCLLLLLLSYMFYQNLVHEVC